MPERAGDEDAKAGWDGLVERLERFMDGYESSIADAKAALAAQRAQGTSAEAPEPSAVEAKAAKGKRRRPAKQAAQQTRTTRAAARAQANAKATVIKQEPMISPTIDDEVVEVIDITKVERICRARKRAKRGGKEQPATQDEGGQNSCDLQLVVVKEEPESGVRPSEDRTAHRRSKTLQGEHWEPYTGQSSQQEAVASLESEASKHAEHMRVLSDDQLEPPKASATKRSAPVPSPSKLELLSGTLPNKRSVCKASMGAKRELAEATEEGYRGKEQSLAARAMSIHAGDSLSPGCAALARNTVHKASKVLDECDEANEVAAGGLAQHSGDIDAGQGRQAGPAGERGNGSNGSSRQQTRSRSVSFGFVAEGSNNSPDTVQHGFGSAVAGGALQPRGSSVSFEAAAVAEADVPSIPWPGLGAAPGGAVMSGLRGAGQEADTTNRDMLTGPLVTAATVSSLSTPGDSAMGLPVPNKQCADDTSTHILPAPSLAVNPAAAPSSATGEAATTSPQGVDGGVAACDESAAGVDAVSVELHEGGSDALAHSHQQVGTLGDVGSAGLTTGGWSDAGTQAARAQGLPVPVQLGPLDTGSTDWLSCQPGADGQNTPVHDVSEHAHGAGQGARPSHQEAFGSTEKFGENNRHSQQEVKRAADQDTPGMGPSPANVVDMWNWSGESPLPLPTAVPLWSVTDPAGAAKETPEVTPTVLLPMHNTTVRRTPRLFQDCKQQASPGTLQAVKEEPNTQVPGVVGQAALKCASPDLDSIACPALLSPTRGIAEADGSGDREQAAGELCKAPSHTDDPSSSQYAAPAKAVSASAGKVPAPGQAPRQPNLAPKGVTSFLTNARQKEAAVAAAAVPAQGKKNVKVAALEKAKRLKEAERARQEEKAAEKKAKEEQRKKKQEADRAAAAGAQPGKGTQGANKKPGQQKGAKHPAGHAGGSPKKGATHALSSGVDKPKGGPTGGVAAFSGMGGKQPRPQSTPIISDQNVTHRTPEHRRGGRAPPTPASVQYPFTPYEELVSDSEDEGMSKELEAKRQQKPKPRWGQAEAIRRAMERQRGMDPNALFGVCENVSVNLDEYFDKPQRPDYKWYHRSKSADWSKDFVGEADHARYREHRRKHLQGQQGK